MDFNRYITAAEFPALADLFRMEGRRVVLTSGAAFARQAAPNRPCGLGVNGALR